MDPRPVELVCRDGYRLHGRWWPGGGQDVVVVACATGVRASYYSRYAAWLAGNGLSCLTFDYRGVGESREPGLSDRSTRWHHWGSLDIDAALAWALEQTPGGRLGVVGHSFGGFGVTLAPHARHVHRLLTVGAQHARWTDYRTGHRRRFWWRWHVLMPCLTLAHGHFPGRRLGWLEDLPAGVALDWARSPRNFLSTTGPGRTALAAAQQAFRAPVLAVSATDDPYATPAAVRRTLSYTPQAPATVVELSPGDLGVAGIGHFGLFHDRFRDSFWPGTAAWLRDGTVAWPAAGR